jgi:hypothetical protein
MVHARARKDERKRNEGRGENLGGDTTIQYDGNVQVSSSLEMVGIDPVVWFVRVGARPAGEARR